MSYIRGFGTLQTFLFYRGDRELEIPFNPPVRTSVVTGSTIYDFQVYVRTLPAVEIQVFTEQSGSPGINEGVEASSRLTWLESPYPVEQGKIQYNVYRYDDPLGVVNPYFLGFTIV